jgi:phosphoglycolate phosphatase-like HAD superfamily hydrolase
MSEPILNVTPQGNRLNDPGVVEIAQAVGLLDTTGTALGPIIQAAPRSAAIQFAHKLFDGISFTEEAQKQQRQAERVIRDELELVQRVQHLLDEAKAAGFKFTVSLNNAGAPIPMAMKA